ncbi:MAG: 3'(2'),5'-bisphosphate nucleotidase CysQ [Saprospiraceae bacterium]|nr:3'(2'),5'-bisphosphate nucleotidase CysQ [Saprospiraceae bacterium]
MNAISSLPSLEHLLNEVRKIARIAGDTVMHYYNDMPTHPEFLKFKEDQSPVTEADMKSHDIIMEELRRLTPEILIISEESQEVPFEKRSEESTMWIVDPIDGTGEFLKGNGEFAIHIGLAHLGKAILGVVHIPVSGKTYFAARHHGAFCDDKGSIKKLNVNEVDMTAPFLKIAHSRSYMNEQTMIYIRSFDRPELFPVGSSLKVMGIAEGIYDFYPKLGSGMLEWDTCAPQIILEEAGGSVVDLERGKPLEYNKENLLQPDFLAIGKITKYRDT